MRTFSKYDTYNIYFYWQKPQRRSKKVTNATKGSCFLTCNKVVGLIEPDIAAVLWAGL